MPSLAYINEIAMMYEWINKEISALCSAVQNHLSYQAKGSGLFLATLTYEVSMGTQQKVTAGDKTCCVVPAKRNFMRTIDYPCEHAGPVRYRIMLYGRLSRTIFTRGKECGECFLLKQKEASIQCAFCDEHIVPGDTVAYYFPADESMVKPHAFRREDGAVVAGKCCADWEALSGRWNGTGSDPIDWSKHVRHVL